MHSEVAHFDWLGMIGMTVLEACFRSELYGVLGKRDFREIWKVVWGFGMRNCWSSSLAGLFWDRVEEWGLLTNQTLIQIVCDWRLVELLVLNWIFLEDVESLLLVLHWRGGGLLKSIRKVLELVLLLRLECLL